MPATAAAAYIVAHKAGKKPMGTGADRRHRFSEIANVYAAAMNFVDFC
jgi:hypothetical protein